MIFSFAGCTALDAVLLIWFKGVTSIGLEVEAVVDGVGVLGAAEVSLLVIASEVEL